MYKHMQLFALVLITACICNAAEHYTAPLVIAFNIDGTPYILLNQSQDLPTKSQLMSQSSVIAHDQILIGNFLNKDGSHDNGILLAAFDDITPQSQLTWHPLYKLDRMYNKLGSRINEVWYINKDRIKDALQPLTEKGIER